MPKVCPQRIIKEAIELLQFIDGSNDATEERIINNLLELDGLQKALYRDGIVNIKEVQGEL